MKGFWIVALSIIATAGLTGCPDDDDCASDPSLCDGGGDAEADADSDGDVPPQYGNLTVTSTPVGGASIELDGDPSGQVTDHTFPNLLTGAHSVLLSLAGRLVVSDIGELGRPTEVNLTAEGASVNIVLYRDLTGRWRRESDGMEFDVTMHDRDEITDFPPASICPETEVYAHGFDPWNVLCIEADETLSLCKTGASECGGERAEGRILDSGRRVEACGRTCAVTYVYTKL